MRQPLVSGYVSARLGLGLALAALWALAGCLNPRPEDYPSQASSPGDRASAPPDPSAGDGAFDAAEAAPNAAPAGAPPPAPQAPGPTRRGAAEPGADGGSEVEASDAGDAGAPPGDAGAPPGEE